jgi:hypothetical protein
VWAEFKIVRFRPGLGQVGHLDPVAADLLGDELQRVEAGHHPDGPSSVGRLPPHPPTARTSASAAPAAFLMARLLPQMTIIVNNA